MINIPSSLDMCAGYIIGDGHPLYVNLPGQLLQKKEICVSCQLIILSMIILIMIPSVGMIQL